MTPAKDTQLLKHEISHKTMEFKDLWGDLSSHCDWTVVMVMLKTSPGVVVFTTHTVSRSCKLMGQEISH